MYKIVLVWIVRALRPWRFNFWPQSPEKAADRAMRDGDKQGGRGPPRARQYCSFHLWPQSPKKAAKRLPTNICYDFLVLLCQHRCCLLLSFDDRYLQTSPVVRI
jgi:hypothetical protein